jgi:cytochrome c biogenesis protein
MGESRVSKNQKGKGFLSLIFDLFRSIRLTIFLLIFLAILSIIGTLIKQNAPAPEYIQRYGIALYEVLNFFNLFDMYHSWWFSAILLLLVLNLVACSLHRLPKILSQVFHDPDSFGRRDSILKTMSYIERIPGNTGEENLRSELRKWFRHVKRTETESEVSFFAEKGRLSRLGVPITHLSILIILVGGLTGSLFGFKGSVNILEGETVDQIYLRLRDREIPKPIGFSVRCDDFSITYYDLQRAEKLVKSYSSKITILEDGKEILKKTVEVNHPLHYKGLAFYQSSYGTTRDITLGVEWKGKKRKDYLKTMEGGWVSIPHSDLRLQLLRYVPQIHNLGEGVQVMLFKPNEEPRPLWVLKNLPQSGSKNGQDFSLTLEAVTSKEYTGLQVTRDPGVWVVWIGSGLMIFGLIVSFFFSHQRVWAKVPKRGDGETVLAGSANKNRIDFEKTFNELVKAVRSKGEGK